MQNYNPNGQWYMDNLQAIPSPPDAGKIATAAPTKTRTKPSILFGFGETTQANLKAVLQDLDLILPAIDLVPSPSTDLSQSHSASNRSSEFAPNPSARAAAPVRNSRPATLQDDYIYTSRGQFAVPSTESRFIQQERKMRKEFLHKKGSRSEAMRSTKTGTGTYSNSKPEKLNAGVPHRLKLVASGIAMILIFCWQLGHSFAAQQPAGNLLEQRSQHNDALTTNASNVAAPKTFEQTLEIGSKNAAAQANHKQNVATTAVPKQAVHNVSTSVASNLDLHKVSMHNLLKMGYEKLRSGSPEQSISIFSEAVRRDRNDPISRRYLGYALLDAGRPAEAIGQFEALRKLRSLQRSDLLAMQHAVQTEKSMQQAKVTQPAQEVGENETLISKYRAAILSDPKDLDSKYNLAVIYSKSGRTAEAIHECLSGMTIANAEEQQRFYRLYASLATSSQT
jgi:hypothetical protein